MDMRQGIDELKARAESEIRSLRFEGGICEPSTVHASHGRGRFTNLFWWDLRIDPGCLREPFGDYTDILITPYRVDGFALDRLGEWSSDMPDHLYVRSECWGNSDSRPHIDHSTGNVHIDFNPEEWDGRIKQILLAKSKDNGHKGPRIAYAAGPDMIQLPDVRCIIYTKKDPKSRYSIAVPEACHFPSVLSKEDKGYDLRSLFDGMFCNILR